MYKDLTLSDALARELRRVPEEELTIKVISSLLPLSAYGDDPIVLLVCALQRAQVTPYAEAMRNSHTRSVLCFNPAGF